MAQQAWKPTPLEEKQVAVCCCHFGGGLHHGLLITFNNHTDVSFCTLARPFEVGEYFFSPGYMFMGVFIKNKEEKLVDAIVFSCQVPGNKVRQKIDEIRQTKDRNPDSVRLLTVVNPAVTSFDICLKPVPPLLHTTWLSHDQLQAIPDQLDTRHCIEALKRAQALRDTADHVEGTIENDKAQWNLFRVCYDVYIRFRGPAFDIHPHTEMTLVVDKHGKKSREVDWPRILQAITWMKNQIINKNLQTPPDIIWMRSKLIPRLFPHVPSIHQFPPRKGRSGGGGGGP